MTGYAAAAEQKEPQLAPLEASSGRGQGRLTNPERKIAAHCSRNGKMHIVRSRRSSRRRSN